ncbi:MAG: histidine--tRNA ligase, partial [Deltaproteobacteria bacterium]
GMERLILILSAEGWGGEEEKLPLFLALQEKSLVDVAFRLKRDLEKQGLRCEIDYEGRSLKSQMRRANRLGAKFVVIFGEDEWSRGVVKVKNMEEGEEREVPVDELASTLGALTSGKNSSD